MYASIGFGPVYVIHQELLYIELLEISINKLYN